MAIYHLSVKIGSRSKGQSAIAASAYRSGKKLTDKQTGIVSDYTRKGGIVHSEVALCANAPSEYADREKLWNAVHLVEKAKNSQLWREFEVALPKELSREEQIKLVKAFVKFLTDQGMCVDWSIHDKGDGNPHAHIMATVRSIKENGEWAPKSKKVYDLDENGEKIYQGKDKSGRRRYKNHKEDYNDWNDKERIEEWRAFWAECCNEQLAENGHSERIDHRSYERQGIEKIPTIHEGYVARKMKAEGKTSERVQINEDIKQRNSLLQQFIAQLLNIGEHIKKLFSEKDKEVKQRGRITDLLSQRNQTLDNDEREQFKPFEIMMAESPVITNPVTLHIPKRVWKKIEPKFKENGTVYSVSESDRGVNVTVDKQDEEFWREILEQSNMEVFRKSEEKVIANPVNVYIPKRDWKKIEPIFREIGIAYSASESNRGANVTVDKQDKELCRKILEPYNSKVSKNGVKWAEKMQAEHKKNSAKIQKSKSKLKR